MRRRGLDFRRPVRKRFPNVVWWTVCGILVLVLIVVLSREGQIESKPTISRVKRSSLSLSFFPFYFHYL